MRKRFKSTLMLLDSGLTYPITVPSLPETKIMLFIRLKTSFSGILDLFNADPIMCPANSIY